MNAEEKEPLNYKNPSDIENRQALVDAEELFFVVEDTVANEPRYHRCTLCNELVDRYSHMGKQQHLISYHAVLSGNKLIGWNRG